MKSCHLFLLVYLVGTCLGARRTKRNSTCESCGPVPDSTPQFLKCVGLPPSDTGKDHLRRLKGMLEATMDVYTFMKSSMTGVPLLSLQGALALNPREDPLQNEDLVHMWLEVKIKPLLNSVTKNFLSCLSTKNFSCSAYQTVVRELSHHYSDMNPVRQKWIYTFFMYPFLAGRVAGCVRKGESSEEWLVKNFGAFKAMARMKDFSKLNMVFSGLKVLHLLSPAQKAELLLRPEVESLENDTISLVFHSLLTGGSGPPPTSGPRWGHNSTSTGSPATYSPPSKYSPYSPPSPHNNLRAVANDFMKAVRPIGSFVHDFVSFTRERDLSEMRITTLTQFLLNWTLAELADFYQPKNTSVVFPEKPKFDVTNVEDWYKQVVIPLLRRILPNGPDLMHRNITLAFHEVYYLDHDKDEEIEEELDVCSVTLDQSSCGLTDAVKNVAYVLHCAAKTNLTMSERTIMSLMEELAKRLTSLVKELTTVDFKELAHDIRQIFKEGEAPSLTQEHLRDPEFIKLWFQIKLMPLLPHVSKGLLTCLSTKNFSCPSYQTIVAQLSKHMDFMDAAPMYSKNIYDNFILPFMLHRHNTPASCMSRANHSAEWLQKNFGFFSKFASITVFYKLNPLFSGLEVLHLLTPNQTAEMLLLPLPTPPEKHVVINKVFDFLLKSPEHKFPEVLHYLVPLATKVNPPCGVYRQVFERLYGAIPYLPPEVEPETWDAIESLITVAPEECVPENITCPTTPLNGSNICRKINSSDLDSYLNKFNKVPCSFPLETYACAKLENFTANQLASLLKCNLPGNSSRSTVMWKMVLTKLSYVLDPALDLLGNMSLDGLSASAVLDVIGEVRVSMLTDEQLMNSSVIRKWFSNRLRGFLPHASGRFLRCFSGRNISCQSYQQILQIFIHQFNNLTSKQQHVITKDFIVHFLSHSGPECVSISNSSAEWLMKNLGPFSVFLSLRQMLHLNPQFKPLEVVPLLSPKQLAELLVVTPPTDRDVVINKIFDYLSQSPDNSTLPEFLSYLFPVLQSGNFSCSTYRTLFIRMDMVKPAVPPSVASHISFIKRSLSLRISPDCIIYSGQCNVTTTNETDICMGVNSTKLKVDNNGRVIGRVCDFAVEELACESGNSFKPEDLALLLMCNRSMNSSGTVPAWKLLLSKNSRVLEQTLDLLTNKTLDPRNPALSVILDALREITLDLSGPVSINDPTFIQLWFKRRLRPFLPAVSPDFLSCLATKDLSCSNYQQIVKILSSLQPQMSQARQMYVYTNFIKVFLSRNSNDSSCSLHLNSSAEWLQRNLGKFSHLVSFRGLKMLYSNFSAMEALPLLTVRQLAQVASTPGQLTTPAQVTMLTNHVPNRLLSAFFDDFSPAIVGHESMFPFLVRSAMLQVVFDRANLSDHSVSDSAVLVWLHNRLRPLLVNLSPQHVAPFFRILAGRNCTIEEQGVGDLNSTISSLNDDTKKEIHNHIVQALKGPTPLMCYGNDLNRSFYSFLERSFLGFQFPNLTTFLSLMPHNRMHQLVNSIPPAHLGDFLRRPDIVDNDAELCVIYNNYVQTPIFLENETLPAVVRRPTLPCVWPSALQSSSRSEANAWFDQRLNNYLVFLTSSLISPNSTHSATCFAFQKLVLVLGDYNYTAADFVKRDFYRTIQAYLTSASVPKCYNASDPELNSTAWFAEYIGAFMPFLTLEALQTFGSEQVIQVFTVNLVNIALLNHSVLPLNLTNYYTTLIYQQDGNFNPLLLPLVCRCVAPGPAFIQLTAQESLTVLQNLTTLCTDLDPQVSAALAGNLGDTVDATAIIVLGSQCTGLSTGQILTIRPQDLLTALSTLSGVVGWNEGQAKAIIRSLLSVFQINGASTLFMLGTLVLGVPPSTFTGIDGSQLITASKNPTFLTHLSTTAQVVQQTFVSQIILVNSNRESIIENVPDDLATEIPRVLLDSFSSTAISGLNQKKWKKQQAVLFFNVIAVESATATLGSVNNLSSSVLTGFTCTSVSTFKKVQIKRLVKACRRRGNNRVRLVETQLTCMYNHLSGDPEITSFDLFPHDMLLYYDYSLVPQAACRSYFVQLGEADFYLFSPALSYRRTALFDNCRSCLDIRNTSLTEDNISVMGTMCCILDASYIVSSHPSILEKLKSCQDLTTAQANAVEILLESGNTQYGAPPTWDLLTLKNLGMLPLYFTSSFYDNFNKKTKRRFLRYFIRVLKRNGVERRKRRAMKREIRKSIRRRSKRSTLNECTVGTINQVTISDDAFPFDYDDITQFNCCLSADTVKDNLAAITDKVDDEEYLKIVLSKLQEAYPSSNTPESQVQLLGPVSRVATVEDVNKWNITQIDTLSALMDSTDGELNSSLAEAIINKYLSHEGNTLGSAELNVIGGINLCSGDVEVLKSISPKSLKEADALDISNCTIENKRALFNIAQQAFSTNTRSANPVSSYQLTQSYLGGADSDYIRSLSISNINMDMSTFTSLDENVVLDLSVNEVRGLLGTNLQELKSYENQTLVRNWIGRQQQSELDRLGINLTGGRTDPASNTTAAPNTTDTTNPTTASNTTDATNPTTASNTTDATNPTTASNTTDATNPTTASNTTDATNPTTVPVDTTATTNPTTAQTSTTAETTITTTATSTTTTNAIAGTTSTGSRVRADVSFSFLVLLVLLITSQHVLM